MSTSVSRLTRQADEWMMMNEIKVIYGSETRDVVDEGASLCIHSS